jgi:hypothetical protein
MDSNVTGKVKDAITSKLAGEPELKRNVIKYINKAEQTENEEKEEKGYLSFLKDPNDLIEIYKIIKSHKISIKEKRKKIKEFLKPEKELNDFFNKILSTKSKTKEESKEATGAGSAGGYEAPLFSEPNSSTTNVSGLTKGDVVKTVREQLEKVEAKEATSSSSSGQYNQPAIWAKSLSKKNWKGATTKYMPGAKRVQVKKKCKTFPYCNQGDIRALKIFENESVQNAIDSVSSTYNLDKRFISEIIFNEIRKRQK